MKKINLIAVLFLVSSLLITNISYAEFVSYPETVNREVETIGKEIMDIHTAGIGDAIVIEDMTNKLAVDLARKIVGDNISVENAKFTGIASSSGFFTSPAVIVGVEEGIVLSTGSVHNILGPNVSNSTSASNGLLGDADLETLIPGYRTHDGTILEFDFIPQNETLQFRYVFGSEEYPDYVNSSFNDVFGLFVNGENVAFIPGTTMPVAINNVNHQLNNQYYRENHYGSSQINVELNGLSTVLTANATVNPGEINKMKIAIADAGDYVYDSAIFIEADSFNSLPVEFPDYALEQEIRRIINKPDGDITKADVYGIERLNLYSKGIKDLEGIQNLVNMQELLLWNNEISDISPLSSLLNLRWLDIGENDISDITSLTNLTNLEFLNAPYNQISDISISITLLRKLRELDLSNNLISLGNIGIASADLSISFTGVNPFSKLTELNKLDLSNNMISNIDQLSVLTDLKELNISENQIWNINSLGQLKQLKALNISYNQVENIDSLANFSELESLDLSYNEVSDLTGLEGCHQLTVLAAYNNKIKDVGSLSNLQDLNILLLSDNQISVVQPIEDLKALNILHLSGNMLVDPNSLNKLTQLLELYTDETYFSAKHCDEQENVSNFKEWKINFSHAVHPDSFTNEHVFVYDEDGNFQSVMVQQGPDDNSIIVKPPYEGYMSGKTYYLMISNQIKSTREKLLNEPVLMKFTIQNDSELSTSRISVNGVKTFVDGALTIKNWFVFFNTARGILDKRAQEDHFYNYIYQLPEDDSYKMLMNSLWPKYSLGGITGLNINDNYGEYYYFDEHFGYDYEMRNFFKTLRSSEEKLADEYNIPDYSFESYLEDINGLVEIAVNNLYASDVQTYIGEIKSITDFISSWGELNEEKTLKSIDLSNSLSKKDWSISTYKMKKGTKSQLSLKSKYSILIEERTFWFDKRETKYIDATDFNESQWVSTNMKAARVYKGNITAIDRGKAEIKVRFFGKPKKIKIEVQD